MRLKTQAVELLQGCTQPVAGRAVVMFMAVLAALRMAIPAALISIPRYVLGAKADVSLPTQLPNPQTRHMSARIHHACSACAEH